MNNEAPLILRALRENRRRVRARMKAEQRDRTERKKLFAAGRKAGLNSKDMGKAAGVDESTVRASFMRSASNG